MERRVLGLIVAGRLGSPLSPLGAPDDLALLPFAGRYRMVDFALATLVNSGVSDIHWCAPRWATALKTYLGRALYAPGGPGRFVLPLAASAEGAGRLYRLLVALLAARPLARALRIETIVVLAADHVLQLDLRHLLEVHDGLRADATLLAVPLRAAEAGGRAVLRIDRGQRIVDVHRPLVGAAPAPRNEGFVLAWGGDLVVRAAALPALLEAMPTSAIHDDAVSLGALGGALRLRAHDVFDAGNAAGGTRAYWHEPATLEDYYVAQMELCTPQPALDLYDPAWPPPGATGLAPAKVVTCRAGRLGQVVDSLLSDGSVIRGGAVIKSVVGPGVLVDSGAEVEDCVLLDGCRIGRRARVRRAVVGAGVVIGEGEEIGYEARPPAPAQVLRSGLTLVPPGPRPLAAAAAGAR